MLRRKKRQPRKPRVYRIPVESYLIALGVAFALAVAISLFNRPTKVRYVLPHAFGVRDATFLPSAQAIGGPGMVGGNSVSILENGDEFFPAMLASIRAAKKSVHMEAYIFWSDSVGRQFRDALAATA